MSDASREREQVRNKRRARDKRRLVRSVKQAPAPPEPAPERVEEIRVNDVAYRCHRVRGWIYVADLGSGDCDAGTSGLLDALAAAQQERDKLQTWTDDFWKPEEEMWKEREASLLVKSKGWKDAYTIKARAVRRLGEERDHWKANHDSQVLKKQRLSERFKALLARVKRLEGEIRWALENWDPTNPELLHRRLKKVAALAPEEVEHD